MIHLRKVEKFIKFKYTEHYLPEENTEPDETIINTLDSFDFYTDSQNPRINLNKDDYFSRQSNDKMRQYITFDILLDYQALESEAFNRTE